MFLDPGTKIVDETDFFPQARISRKTGLAFSADEEELELLDAIREAEEESGEEEESIPDEIPSVFNLTNLSSQRLLPLNRSKLIDYAATLFKELLKTLRPQFGARQPVLEKMEVYETEDGDAVNGVVYFTVEVFPISQPGMNWSYEDQPLRGKRITVPIEIQNGDLLFPTKFIDSGGREFPLNESTIANFLLGDRETSFVRKRSPKVYISWDIPRDYRAF